VMQDENRDAFVGFDNYKISGYRYLHWQVTRLNVWIYFIDFHLARKVKLTNLA